MHDTLDTLIRIGGLVFVIVAGIFLMAKCVGVEQDNNLRTRCSEIQMEAVKRGQTTPVTCPFLPK